MRQPTALRAATDPFGHQRRLYDQAARLALFGAWECDLATEALSWTDGVYDLFEMSVGTSLKRASTVDLYLDESRRNMELMRAETIRTGKTCTLDAQIRTIKGNQRWMRLSIGIDKDGDGPGRLFGAKQDVTSERAAWERLRRIAEHDPLTGLANRGVFDALYHDVVRDELHHGSVSALALIDLDLFKQINDRFGHAAGDECLRQTATRLQGVFPNARLIARIGGDEFAVLLQGDITPARAAFLLRRASASLCQPLLWNGLRIDLGASIGATILGRPHRRNLARLFEEADSALYAAKADGRRTLHVFGDATAPALSLSGRPIIIPNQGAHP